MSTFRLLLGLTWLVLVLLWGAMWNRSATVPEPAPMRVYTAWTIDGSASGRQPSVEPRRDLYGNEISEAVGDYRVDPRGELYERHSPDTAVLKLGPPGT